MLLSVGRTSVKDALGFFLCDHRMYVAANKGDVERFSTGRGGGLLPMEALEEAYRSSGPLKFISWCETGCIVPQGARQVTFRYNTDTSVVRMR